MQRVRFSDSANKWNSQSRIWTWNQNKTRRHQLVMVQKQGVLQLWVLLGLCLGVNTQDLHISGASRLHGQVSTAAYRSNGRCRIRVDSPVVMDKDLLQPVPKMGRNCTLNGARDGSLVFPDPVAFFSAGKGVVFRMENLRVVYWQPVSFFAMFLGMMDSSDGATLAVQNVVFEVTQRCLDLLREEIELMELSPMEVDLGRDAGNEIILKSVELDSLSLVNVTCVGVRTPLLRSEWLAPMRYYVKTKEQLVHSLAMAEGEGDHNAVEIVVVGVIIVTRDDLPGGRPFDIRRKVVLNGLGDGGTLVLGRDLANGRFLQIKETGNVVLKDLEVEFNGVTSTPSLPLGFNDNDIACHLHMLNSILRTSCLSMKTIFEEQIVAAVQNGHALAALDLGKGDPRTTEVMAGNILGICLYQSKVTCQISSSSGAREITASSSEDEQGKPTLQKADDTSAQVAGSSSGHSKHEEGFQRYSHVIVGILVVVNALLLFILSCVLCARCKRKLDSKEAGRNQTRRSDMRRLHSLPSRFSSTPTGNGAERTWSGDSSKSSNTELEFLHEIHEEGRGIEDEIMELKEQVGSGGYGVVYKAVWHGLPVAVKTVIFEDNKKDSRHKKRAICEAAISSSISHRNLVQTYTYFFHKLPPPTMDSQGTRLLDSVHWKMHIVLEFCELGSLSRSVRRGTFVDMETRAPDMYSILHVAHDIASGMRHLHSRNIVHGDLTARNILLKREKNCIVGKISDFGLSVKLRRHQSFVSNHRAGTRMYMAPELISSGRLSKSSDLYSFGIILWELYHLSLPTPMAFPHHEARPRFSSSCPMPYVLLCATCLNPKPLDRMDFSRVVSILGRLMALLRTNASAGTSTKEINKEWSDLATGLNPSEVSSLLETHLPNLDTVCIDANSPTMSSTTDTPVFSSLSPTPPSTLHADPPSPPRMDGDSSKIGMKQGKPHHVAMMGIDRSGYLASSSLDDADYRTDKHQESVTVELTKSSDTDMVSFGWVNSGDLSQPGGGMQDH